MSLQPKHIYVTLCTLFIVYSFSIYLQPYFKNTVADTDAIAAGRIVWQKNNCQTCHQLYGLGGYLGPDLTDVYSAPGKGKDFIRAMLATGIKQMPPFHLSEKEFAQLTAYLKSVDESGNADPRQFKKLNTGMIEEK
jgi:nitric oxide reductase subunit C